MKYIFTILLISSIFFLSACFEKKLDDTVATGAISDSGALQTQGTQEEITSGEMPVSEASGATIVGETDTGEANPEVQISPQEAISSGEQQEIVQEAEEDLEALFDDLMKGE